MRGFWAVNLKKIGKPLFALFLVAVLVGGSGVLLRSKKYLGFSKRDKAAAQEQEVISNKFTVIYTGYVYVPPIVYDTFRNRIAVDHVELYAHIENGGSGSFIENPFNSMRVFGGDISL